MMHYRKGENIEQELTKDELPFDDCLPKLPQKDFLWMHVRGGTKVHNVINYAKNALDKGEYRTVVWSGSGGGVVKTVSCAEILKRSYPLYQLTRMDQITIEEHWVPQMDGLEPIVAKRKVPSLHILMTLDPIDESIADVQKPNTTTEYWRGWSGNAQQQQQKHTRHARSGNEGRMQQQRNQRSKQSRQGKPQNTETRQELEEEDQQRPHNSNRNRGDQRKVRKESNVGQQQPQQFPEASQESQHQQQRQPRIDGQQREQQLQRHRQPKPKQRQQQQQQQNQSAEAMQMEAAASASTSSTPSTINSSSAAAEPMES